MSIITGDQMILNIFSSLLDPSENLMTVITLSSKKNVHVHRHKKIHMSFFYSLLRVITRMSRISQPQSLAGSLSLIALLAVAVQNLKS